ncbi:hypothetical protein C7974DRAFT_372393 [Boeremia exigua]|uniref:uncharacterized protein n=1 Tax=Boeremia exigua TaxID=749465 RepID=UPI001E8DE88F|nr:uncharacterized protein C7974DRAFT_372393 [Boeremia exigua]KAH6642460.1 hypothetical protein C7974DRAFT_372393 [Boeremia exigua]
MSGERHKKRKFYWTPCANPTNENVASGTQADAMKAIRKIRAALAMLKYLNNQNQPNVNGRLTARINNIGDRFRALQAAHNAAYPDDQTTIAEFWSEWVKALYTWAIYRVNTVATAAIDLLRETMENSSDPGAQNIMSFMEAYELDLKRLEINTSSMI